MFESLITGQERLLEEPHSLNETGGFTSVPAKIWKYVAFFLFSLTPQRLLIQVNLNGKWGLESLEH